MAINVDNVYRTVLLIMNKEQRGYLTPVEFNKIATQVQREILEEYFQALNQQSRVKQNDSEYGDRLANAENSIEPFKTTGLCDFVNSASGEKYFSLPLSSGATTYTQTISNTVVGKTVYPLTTITVPQLNDGLISVTKNGAVITSGYSFAQGNFILTTAPTATTDSYVITVKAYDFYKLGTVYYEDAYSNIKEVELIQRNELLYNRLSSLTTPTETFPVYLYENNKIIAYPQTITSNVSASYIRRPSDVMWNFTVNSATGAHIYSPGESINFELNESEQPKVVLEILKYAGVMIKDITIAQAAANEIAQTDANKRN